MAQDTNSRRQLTDDAKEFIRRMRLFEPMVKSEAWKELTAIALAQQQNQRLQLDAPVVSESEEKLQNYYKGIIFGINLMITTPSRIIEDARSIIAQSGGEST